MKRFCTLFLSLTLLLLCLVPTASAAGSVTIKVNGTAVIWTDAQPFINSDGRTMVPLRAVADAMGLDVSWDSSTRTASFSQSGVAYNGKCPWTNTIQFPIGKKTAIGVAAANWVNSEPDIDYSYIQMDTAAVIKNGRTYAPVRYLSEYFDCTVKWNGSTQTVTITGDLPESKVSYVSPTTLGSNNPMKGTWEVITWRWTQASLEKMGMVQSSGYLIFQPGGKMAYQCFDQCYLGTYLINAKSTGNSCAVCYLNNGWVLTIDATTYNGKISQMTVHGMPQVTCGSADGVYYSTTDWEFKYWNSSTTIGVDSWLQ